MKIRVKFEKKGPIRFVGHLDFMRCFQKILKKSSLEPVYTFGFNPHIVLSFAAPLGVGEETLGDYADVEFAYRDRAELTEQEAYRLSNIGLENDELPDPPSTELFVQAFNDAAPEGVRAVTATRVGLIKSSKAMALVRYASFLVVLKDGFMCELDPSEMSEKVSEFSSREEIVVHKVTKKSEKDVDIKPLLVKMNAVSGQRPEFVVSDDFQKDRVIEIVCAQGSSQNLKPSAILEAFCAYCGSEYDACGYRVIRTELFDDDLVPLCDLGTKF